MRHPLSRRTFATAGISAAAANLLLPACSFSQDKTSAGQTDEKPKGPTQAPFDRDYPAPKFKPSWKKPQLSHQMVQDFVLFGHNDLEMVKKLVAREPALVHASVDWGGGDFETALGGASHMGRKDIATHLLKHGARVNIFTAAMMGMLDVVKAFITMEPALIDAKGPHGFTLHFHAQVGQENAKPVLDYLQSVKELELRPVPFLKNRKPTKK